MPHLGVEQRKHEIWPEWVVLLHAAARGVEDAASQSLVMVKSK
jgi:hypothetical protein